MARSTAVLSDPPLPLGEMMRSTFGSGSRVTSTLLTWNPSDSLMSMIVWIRRRCRTDRMLLRARESL